MKVSRPYTPQQPEFTRAALAPGLLGAIVLLAGLALVGSSWYLYILYAVSVLACILGVFAGQAKQWWWLLGLIPIVVLWNPIFPIKGVIPALPLLSFGAAVIFVCAGILIKTPLQSRS